MEHELFKDNQKESEKVSPASESSIGRWSSSVWESEYGRGNECLRDVAGEHRRGWGRDREDG